MSYYVRLMRKEDVTQVTEIDREAFPSQWPAPNYQRELRNRLAYYLVACDEDKTVDVPEVKAYPEQNLTGLLSRLRRLFSRLNFSSNEPPSSSGHGIVGFAGFWVMADEAHIISIAVREAYRRQGLGELMLISLIALAIEQKAGSITLEVRVSNTGAQSLYSKYSFTEVGIRRGYYIDNKEDGLIMSTDDITSAAFQAHLQQLKQAHSRKWGIASSQIVR